MEAAEHTIDVDRIVEISEVHPLKIRNIYIFGSQVYGYARKSSDYDVVMVAPGLLGREIKHEIYNIHQVMPDSFADQVSDYKIRAMECVFAPEWARPLEKQKFEVKIIVPKLIGSILSQSHDMWNQAKRKMFEEDVMRGNKGAFHSLKTLIYGIDIAKNGRITDFEAIKPLHEEFTSHYFFRWDDLRDTYLSRKKELEDELKSLSTR